MTTKFLNGYHGSLCRTKLIKYRYISTKATVVIVAALAATAVLAGPIGVGLIVAGAGFAAAGHAGYVLQITLHSSL